MQSDVTVAGGVLTEKLRSHAEPVFASYDVVGSMNVDDHDMHRMDSVGSDDLNQEMRPSAPQVSADGAVELVPGKLSVLLDSDLLWKLEADTSVVLYYSPVETFVQDLDQLSPLLAMEAILDSVRPELQRAIDAQKVLVFHSVPECAFLEALALGSILMSDFGTSLEEACELLDCALPRATEQATHSSVSMMACLHALKKAQDLHWISAHDPSPTSTQASSKLAWMQFGDASAALDGDSQISAVVVLRLQDESTPTLEAACIAAPAARSQHHAPTSYTLSSRDQNTPDHDMVSKFLEICEWEKGVVAMCSDEADDIFWQSALTGAWAVRWQHLSAAESLAWVLLLHPCASSCASSFACAFWDAHCELLRAFFCALERAAWRGCVLLDQEDDVGSSSTSSADVDQFTAANSEAPAGLDEDGLEEDEDEEA